MNMKLRTLTIGIAPFKACKARALAIASGKYKPNKDEPKIWFSSIELVGKLSSTKALEAELDAIVQMELFNEKQPI